MRRSVLWAAGGALAVALAIWGVWTWRLNTANRDLALALEAERQRNFSEMVHHVEQIQSLLGKGLVSGTTRQNMRYMSDVHHHSMAAANSFTALPLPAELGAATGKFLQQTGDFAVSVLRNEAAGRELDEKARGQLARLRSEAAQLSGQLHGIVAQYSQSGHRWNPPLRFSWSALWNDTSLAGKPATGAQAPASMAPGGWDQVATTMQQLPVMIYDGPFSDHLADRSSAMSGAPVSREEAAVRMREYLPNGASYQVAGVEEVNGNLPAYSFRLAPAGTAAPPGATAPYTSVVEVTRNGGFLLQLLNSRLTGSPTIDLERASTLGREYLDRIGYKGIAPTYGQVADGAATIAYAYQDNGVIVYPDQVKLKVALDNGEILAVDARQYLMSHHTRTIGKPTLSPGQAEQNLNPALAVQRVQLALIPNLAGSGEILTYEFLTTFGEETYLVYINAQTGQEEQILQKVQTDGGTFTL